MRVCAGLVLLAACSSRPSTTMQPNTAEHWAGSLAPAPRPNSPMVAIVAGDPIYATDVELQMRATHQTSAQALEELIHGQLLAQEAFRRGLADDTDAVEARKRESVRLLLAREFEPTFSGPEAIADEHVQAILRLPNIRKYYDHDEYRRIDWTRVEVATDAPIDEVARARERAQAVHVALVAARPRNQEEFFTALEAIAPALGALKSRGQHIVTAWNGPAVAAFAKAAFELDRPGALSPPTRTQWGWDVLFFDAVEMPARHTPAAEAEADVRKNRFEPLRKEAFLRWLDSIVATHRIVVNDQYLDAVQVDSVVGLP